MVYRGFVKNGRVELDDVEALPDGAEVRVELVDPAKPRPATPSTPLGVMLLRHAGSVANLPQDLSTNHDHYLYGTPKR